MNLVGASGDKESYVVIMSKIDYQNKLNGEINYGLHKIIYEEEEDNSYITGSKSTTIMRKCWRYENQTGWLYQTLKCHKSKNMTI